MKGERRGGLPVCLEGRGNGIGPNICFFCSVARKGICSDAVVKLSNSFGLIGYQRLTTTARCYLGFESFGASKMFDTLVTCGTLTSKPFNSLSVEGGSSSSRSGRNSR